MELEGRSKNGVQKCEEDEIKGSKSGVGSSEIDLVLVFNMFPRLFPIKDVVELTEKAENALRSKSKSAAVHQKETKLNKKGRSASAIMSRGRCIDHPQKWKVLDLSIDRSRTVASQYLSLRYVTHC